LYANICFNDWQERLPTKNNEGGTVSWDDLSLTFDVTPGTLAAHKLEISALDGNEKTAPTDVFIGTFATSLAEISNEVWNSGSIALCGELPLDEKGQPSGSVEVAFSFEPNFIE
jgi:hypothetical protein